MGHITGVKSNTIPLLEHCVHDLEQGNIIDGLMAHTEAMGDCLNTQHEEIAVLQGCVCQCRAQPRIIEEEIEGIKELHAEEVTEGENPPGWQILSLLRTPGRGRQEISQTHSSD